MATPMLPNTAIPRAPPSSAAVSEMPAAAPARSGGAAPMIRSLVRVNSGAVPSENSTDPRTMTPNPDPLSSWVNTANPTAAMASPPAISGAGRMRRGGSGGNVGATTKGQGPGNGPQPPP